MSISRAKALIKALLLTVIEFLSCNQNFGEQPITNATNFMITVQVSRRKQIFVLMGIIFMANL